MTFLGPPRIGNFKSEKTPHKKEKRSADKRPGMDPEHLANIRKLPSCVSGKRPCEAHHLKQTGTKERGVSLKSTDKWAVPLTHDEHINGVERVGSKKEFEWFTARGVNPIELAKALWANRGDLEAMEKVIAAHARRP